MSHMILCQKVRLKSHVVILNERQSCQICLHLKELYYVQTVHLPIPTYHGMDGRTLSLKWKELVSYHGIIIDSSLLWQCTGCSGCHHRISDIDDSPTNSEIQERLHNFFNLFYSVGCQAVKQTLRNLDYF